MHTNPSTAGVNRHRKENSGRCTVSRNHFETLIRGGEGVVGLGQLSVARNRNSSDSDASLVETKSCAKRAALPDNGLDHQFNVYFSSGVRHHRQSKPLGHTVLE